MPARSHSVPGPQLLLGAVKGGLTGSLFNVGRRAFEKSVSLAKSAWVKWSKAEITEEGSGDSPAVEDLQSKAQEQLRLIRSRKALRVLDVAAGGR